MLFPFRLPSFHGRRIGLSGAGRKGRLEGFRQRRLGFFGLQSMLGPILVVNVQNGNIVLVFVVPFLLGGIGNIDLIQGVGIVRLGEAFQNVLDLVTEGAS